MKDLYFTHDQNALNDIKISELRGLYGMEGYGTYWALIEAMCREDDASLLYADRRFGALKVAFQTSFDLKQFVDDCIEIGLFVSDGERFWSESLRKRLSKRQTQSDTFTNRGKVAAEARWKKAKENANSDATDANEDAQAMHKHTASNAQAMLDDAKIKENIEENIYINNNRGVIGGECGSDEKPAETNSEPPVFEIPLNDKTFYPLRQTDVDHFKDLYRAVDVPAEIRKMIGWLEGNPDRRKTKRGVNAFINRWLAKAQDSGCTKAHTGRSNSPPPITASGVSRIIDYDDD